MITSRIKPRAKRVKQAVATPQQLTGSQQAPTNPIKVKARLVSKRFDLNLEEEHQLKSLMDFKRVKPADYWALRNINFEVYEGETIGVVGLNGAGKSTLLNILDQSMKPTTGELEINGEVSYIAIGAGLKAGITGRDNIRLKGTMMGWSKQEIEDRMQSIIDFSELGPFIDNPVKEYSSGMRSKLAFSIAVNQDPDILIIDEALSVGDSTFTEKSAKKMFEFREKGKTIFVVTHSAAQIKKWADKVLWLHYGEVKDFGPTAEVMPKYSQFVSWFNGLSEAEKESYKDARREEQLSYSVDALKKEVYDNTTDDSRHFRNWVDKTIETHSSLQSGGLQPHLIVAGLLFVMFLTSLVVTSDKSMVYALTHPADFVAHHLFKAKKKFDLKNVKKVVKPKPTVINPKPEAPKSASSTSEATFDYQVMAGDTLSDILVNYGLALSDLEKLNPGVNLDHLEIGQILKLPKRVEGKYQVPASVSEVSSESVSQEAPVTDTPSGANVDTTQPVTPNYPEVSQPTPDPTTPGAGGDETVTTPPSVSEPSPEVPGGGDTSTSESGDGNTDTGTSGGGESGTGTDESGGGESGGSTPDVTAPEVQHYSLAGGEGS